MLQKESECFFNGDFCRICESVNVCTQFACISIYISDEFQWAILFTGKNSQCSHHNWTNIILNILMWEKIILCGRPKWARVPMKSHFSPQNRPEVIHRPFVCFWRRDKAYKKLDDSYVSSMLVDLSPTGVVSLFPFVLFGFSHLLPPDLDKKYVCSTAPWCDSSASIHVLAKFLSWHAGVLG